MSVTGDYTTIEDSDPNLIRARIESKSEESLEEGILMYYNNYNPLGYGTFLESRNIIDGLHIAIMVRYTTCE